MFLPSRKFLCQMRSAQATSADMWVPHLGLSRGTVSSLLFSKLYATSPKLGLAMNKLDCHLQAYAELLRRK
jgi:hypothetical protein